MQASRTAGRGDPSWAGYNDWNSSLAETLFSPQAVAGRPVYLDLEPAALESAWDRAGRFGENPTLDLAASVRKTLILNEQAGDVFRLHTNRLTRWGYLNDGEPPPTIALLAVLSLAAEDMAAGEGMAAHNYYGRLFQLLRITEVKQRSRVSDGYRHVSERLWESLNRWLNEAEGERGLPTARALGPHRHVGLPIGQALVRADDRAHLRDLLTKAGLAPGESVSVSDMVSILDACLAEGAPDSLLRLWGLGDEARERIAEIASVELEARVGVDDAAGIARPARLTMARRTFLQQGVEFGIVARLPGSVIAPRDVALLEVMSDVVMLESTLIPTVDGLHRLEDTSAIEPSSLLASTLRLRVSEDGSELVHKPKAMYVFARSDATKLYVEHERVVLGSDHALLVTRRLIRETDEALASLARPGYRRFDADSVEGLPSGWSLYDGVQVLTSPAEREQDHYRNELNALIPIAQSQLTIEGGVRIPGLIKKWSSLAPPEVRAIGPAGSTVTVRVDCSYSLAAGLPPEPLVVESEAQALIVDLAAAGLPDGDYEVSAQFDRSGHATNRRTLRLRSAATPARSTSGDHVIAYHPSALLWPISATSVPQGTDPLVRGAIVHPRGSAAVSDGGGTTLDGLDLDDGPAAESSQPERVRLTDAGVRDCLVDGHHRFRLPDAGPDQPHRGWDWAACQRCGFVRRFPRSWAAARRRGDQPGPSSPRPFSIPGIPPVDPTRHPDTRAILDATFHLGNGPTRHVEHLAKQVDATALFAWNYVRALEALGHIDIARSETDLQPERFQVTPAALVETSVGTFRLVGCASRALADALREAAEATGARLDVVSDDLGMGHLMVSEVARDDVVSMTDQAERACGVRVQVVRDGAARLIELLPPLSELVAALPVGRVPPHRSAQLWAVGARAWRATETIERAGAYRLESRGIRYGLRSASDISAGTMAFADASVVRHAIGLFTGRPMVSYDAGHDCLVVPLGAGLPGLYGRAAVLATGALPRLIPNGAGLAYVGIGPSVAAALVDKLSR